MKRILLMRHAKSSWDEPGLTDKDRPLNQRGLDAAENMSHWIPRQGLLPDFILHSSSVRTTETVQVLKRQWDLAYPTIETRSWDSLYLAPPQSILDAIGQTDESVQTLLLVAHNPGLEELVAFVDRQYHRFPTAAIAEINLANQPWDLALSDPRKFLDQCQLHNVWRPKELFASPQRDAC